MCGNLAVQPEYNVLAINFGTDPAIGTDPEEAEARGWQIQIHP